MNENGNRLPIVEALIFSSPEPLPARKIVSIVGEITPRQVEEIVDSLNDSYLNGNNPYRIRRIAGGYQTYITENYAGYVQELFTLRRSQKLSRAALETLAIIAYRQPVTKADIEMIRGVASDSAVHTLLQKKLITLSGRAKTIGRPLLYRTTDEFLKYFDLHSLEDLPRMQEIEELLSSEDSDAQQKLALMINGEDKGVIALTGSGDETDGKFDDDTDDMAADDAAGDDPVGDVSADEAAIEDDAAEPPAVVIFPAESESEAATVEPPPDPFAGFVKIAHDIDTERPTVSLDDITPRERESGDEYLDEDEPDDDNVGDGEETVVGSQNDNYHND